MENNIITEDNLAIIRDLIPNIVYKELQGNLEISDEAVEIPAIEPIIENEEAMRINQEIKDIEELMQYADSAKEKKSLKQQIDELNELLKYI
jgi:hypothetical protein